MADRSSGPPTRSTLLLRLHDSQDAEAWRTFVKVYAPLVLRYCCARGLQPADAQDVTQEVLLQVSRSIQKFEYRPEKGRFRDWLGTLTRNKIFRFLSKAAGQTQAQGDAEAGAALDRLASPEQDTEWVEAFNTHLYHTALASIRSEFEDKSWRAFEFVWSENRPAAEVARELAMSLDAVYVTKSRVLKRLQEKVVELAEDGVCFVR